MRGVLGVLESHYPVLPLLAPKILRLRITGSPKAERDLSFSLLGGEACNYGHGETAYNFSIKGKLNVM